MSLEFSGRKMNQNEHIQKFDSISDFFRNASKEEKIKLFREVAKEASEDQRKLLREYDRKIKAAHAR